MQALSRISGFVLIAAGLLVALISYLSPGQVLVGLSFDVAAILVVGGVLSLGLSGVMQAIAEQGLAPALAAEMSLEAEEEEMDEPEAAVAPAVPPSSLKLDPPSSPPRDFSYAARSAAVIAAATGASSLTPPPPPPPAPEPKFQPALNDEPEAQTEEVSEADLYVVDEKIIAGCPARVLSDGTVEAETDEGWMRFENVEHLEEYMAAMRG